MIVRIPRFLCVLFLFAITAAVGAQAPDPLAWPKIERAARPWTYWWWPGSAVKEADITAQLKTFKAAGLGGVHIIPIYGPKGRDAECIDFLSPRWMAVLAHTVRTARSMDMDVDMTLGSGWCFGGPEVTPEEGGLRVDPRATEFRTVPSRLKVKRAGPGGQGLMLNPFYGRAIDHYLERFTKAFDAYDGPRPRAIYHDSYEYFGCDWSPDLLAEFERRRGYKLQDHLDAIRAKDGDDTTARVKGDYRETMSDLMVERFAPTWTKWAKERGMLSRYQAHGSPANLADLYAAADTPETEMFNKDRDVLVSKFASSAAHVAGRPRVSSETGTWLDEHFHETLAEMKRLQDELFVSGVNHLFYHGNCYSPADAPWPGWLFYASTEMNPRNSIWHDVPVLNAYAARCQSVLQSGTPDNDVLLYWPIHDLWDDAAGGTVQTLTVHNANWLTGQAVGRLARRLWAEGVSFDYVSDRQLATVQADGNGVRAGGSAYRVIVVPETRHMPIETIRRLVELAQGGATVLFESKLPEDVPGLARLDERRAELKQLVGQVGLTGAKQGVARAKVGKGTVIVAANAEQELARQSLAEPLKGVPGLQFIRRRGAESSAVARQYFLTNLGETAVDRWVGLAGSFRSVGLLDPMTGKTGMAATRQASAPGVTEVYLQLEPGQSMIVRAFAGAVNAPAWSYVKAEGESVPLAGAWKLKFVEGGPALPREATLDKLASWTTLADPAAAAFAGTAVYSTTFDAPPDGGTGAFILDLGRVCESARVRLNGADVAALIQPPYRTVVRSLKPTGNVLEVEVTNLSANRIRDLDRRKVNWKVMGDINIVNIDYKPLDATNWPIVDSGLLGPVTLRPAVMFEPGTGEGPAGKPVR
jgi:hypothetical protein